MSLPGLLEQSVLPEEQIAVFADCGWEYVTDRGFLHIFRAPQGSSAPEFYMDPAQQAETLRRFRRDAIWGWVPSMAVKGNLAAYITYMPDTSRSFDPAVLCAALAEKWA